MSYLPFNRQVVGKSLVNIYEEYSTIIRLIGRTILWILTWYLAKYSISAYITDNQFVMFFATSMLFLQTLISYYILSLYVFPRYLYELHLIPLSISLLIIFWLIYVSNYYGLAYLSDFNTVKPTNSPFGNIPYTVAMTERLKNVGILGCFINARVALWNFAYSFYIASIYLVIKAISAIVKFRNKAILLEKEQLRLEVDNLRLRQENSEIELDFLRSQINPHSLFNVLNSVYADVFETNEKAADLILRLSELMRYNLYDADVAKISLDKELAYIQNYLNLEQNRLSDQNVSIDYAQNGRPEQYQIVPLLLIAFVENAFKHGIKGAKSAAYVEVLASVEEGQLMFQVENSIPPKRQPPVGEAVSVARSGGIGLVNVRRRLDTIYKDQYKLVVTLEEDRYIIVLTVQIEPVSKR